MITATQISVSTFLQVKSSLICIMAAGQCKQWAHSYSFHDSDIH